MDRMVDSDRIIKAHTPLPADQLRFRAMHGAETMSQLFEFDVDLAGRVLYPGHEGVAGQAHDAGNRTRPTARRAS